MWNGAEERARPSEERAHRTHEFLAQQYHNQLALNEHQYSMKQEWSNRSGPSVPSVEEGSKGYGRTEKQDILSRGAIACV